MLRRAGQDDGLAYSHERKAAVLAKMLPPNNMPLSRLAKEEGISATTLAKWRAEARAKGQFLPDANAGPEGWTSEDKLAAVIETASLNEAELGEYCRRSGIYAEQLAVWRAACGRANDWDRAAASRIARETKEARQRIQQLERELARKEKALAEAAALMILRKKVEAIWGPEGGAEE
jgi:transposase-like protein